MKIGIIGSNIGRFIFELLIGHELTLYDSKPCLISNGTGLFIKVETINFDKDVTKIVENNDIIISTYPTYTSKKILEIIKDYDNKCFIDVFGDTRIIDYCSYISDKSKSTLIPFGGLSGISVIICNELVKNIERIKSIEIKCGILPKYEKGISRSFFASDEIGQYLDTCHIIQNSKKYEVPALSGFETINLNGVLYEAFNVSSSSHILDIYNPENYSYKLLKFPGVYNKIKCLVEDFKLSSRPSVLFDVFAGLPIETDIKTIIFCEVIGNDKNVYIKTFESGIFDGIVMSSYQALISYSVCSLVELYINNKISGNTSICKIPYGEFVSNRYGGILKI